MHSKIPHYLTDKSSPFDSSSRSPDKIKITVINKTCLCIWTVLYHYFLFQNKQTCFDNKVFLFEHNWLWHCVCCFQYLQPRLLCQMPKCNTYQSKNEILIEFLKRTNKLKNSFEDYHFQKMALYVQGKYCYV